MRKQIENHKALNIIAKGFGHFNSKSTYSIRVDLSKSIKRVREFIKASREGAHDYLNAYPCGYQDAFGDKVEAMFEDFEALKLAYRLSTGDGEALSRLVNDATGGYNR